MAIYVITYEVEADDEYEALRKVRDSYDEPTNIDVEGTEV